MIRPILIAAALLLLPACREDIAALPRPVALTEESTGHYCQMELLEHPGPKAQAHLAGLEHPLFFSQVRDVVAYQRMPEQSHVVTVAYVSDMGAPGATWDDPGAENWIAATEAHYVVGSAIAGGMGAPGATWDDPGAENWIAATEAHYVVGSAIAGGMGAPELVPFSRPEDAQAFAARHGGQVLRLDQIPDSAVLAPVETGDNGSEADEDEFQRRLQDLQTQEQQG